MSQPAVVIAERSPGRDLTTSRRATRRWVSAMADPKFGLGLVLLSLVLGVAIFAPLLVRHDPLETELTARLAAPAWLTDGNPDFILGADPLGRDVWARIAFGARNSLIVGLCATALAAFLGVSLGAIAGFWGSWPDAVVMRLGDVLLSIPSILLALAVIVVLGPSIVNLILVLGLSQWIYFGRIIRSEVLSLREREFIQAGIALGATSWRLIWRHILPNVVGSATVLATLTIARTIIAESSLSFLGLGIPPPTPSWGSMLSDGRPYLSVAWWVCIMPGLALMATVIAVNLLGDWLRDVLDPRLNQGVG